MTIQDDNTILSKADLKAYHQKILPYLGGNAFLSTSHSDYYSTEEKMIGIWIDGKPIYQKTWTNIDISGMIDGVNHNIIDITSLNADSTVDIRAIAHQLTSGQKYDYTNTFFSPASTSAGEPLKVNVWRRSENYIGFNATSLSITSVDVTFCYTKTTDTATTALTTPGAYDLNRPDLWPTNKEIFFGNGLYGYRRTGTITAASDERVWTNIVTLSAGTIPSLVQSGGWIKWGDEGEHDYKYPINSTMTGLTGWGSILGAWSVVRTADQQIALWNTTGLVRTNQPFDVWVTYTK